LPAEPPAPEGEMAAERLAMRKTREILRQKFELGLSHRKVARSLGVSVGTVSETLSRAMVTGLGSWAAVQALDDVALEERLYGPSLVPGTARPMPDCNWIHTELRRTGVTLQLLHFEYLEKHPEGYRYSQFCEHYRRWVKRQRRSMRQVHRAGEKLFVDYSGKKPHYVDPGTGEVIEVELFVAVLGASNFTYAEATRTQQGPDWIASHVRCFEYLQGVPGAVVPDQLKSGVTKSCRYEPGVQRTYEEMATHYGTVILPARPKSPRDKAKVETGVQIAQRWILARIRNETFFSLEALNARIRELLDELNNRVMRVYRASRRELFLRLDQPALRGLPPERFVYGDWKYAGVNIDYHVELDGHYYSVPHQLQGQKLDLRHTSRTVEIYHRGQRVASHRRSFERGKHTTVREHMPKAHQKHLDWSPSRLVRWGESIGPETGRLVEAILASRRHPEQGYRSCMGILRLGRQYGDERLEAASARALVVHALSYRSVAAILKNGLDRVPLLVPAKPATETTPLQHENIRGADYYQ
jgi:transposase